MNKQDRKEERKKVSMMTEKEKRTKEDLWLDKEREKATRSFVGSSITNEAFVFQIWKVTFANYIGIVQSWAHARLTSTESRRALKLRSQLLCNEWIRRKIEKAVTWRRSLSDLESSRVALELLACFKFTIGDCLIQGCRSMYRYQKLLG